MATKKKTTAPVEETTAPAIARVLKVTKPLMRGEDVSALHAALAAHKLKCGADANSGVYGAATAYAVRMLQAKKRIIVTGRVEKFTAAALGLEFVE